MEKEIMKDVFFLGQECEEATKADSYIAGELWDTMNAHRNECVGLAANMIGYKKRIISVNIGLSNFVIYNPVITKKTGAYETEEGCLSLPGLRKTTRYKEITVSFLDEHFQKREQDYSGWVAQIIQHEIDHCNGILI